MAFPTAVNDQIIDAVAYLSGLATGASQEPIALLDAVAVQTLGTTMHNAVTRQQTAGVIGATAVTAACARMLSMPDRIGSMYPDAPHHQTRAEAEAALDQLRVHARTPSRPVEAVHADLDGTAGAPREETKPNPVTDGPDAVDLSKEGVFGGARDAVRRSATQSAAMALQDATDMVRNASTVAMTAQSVAFTLLMATRDPAYAEMIAAAQTMLREAIETYRKIGLTAADVLRAFNEIDRPLV